MSSSSSSSTVVKKGFTFRRSSTDARKAAVNSLTSLINAKNNPTTSNVPEKTEKQVARVPPTLSKKTNLYQPSTKNDNSSKSESNRILASSSSTKTSSSSGNKNSCSSDAFKSSTKNDNSSKSESNRILASSSSTKTSSSSGNKNSCSSEAFKSSNAFHRFFNKQPKNDSGRLKPSDIISKAAIDLTEDDDDVIPDVAPCIKDEISDLFGDDFDDDSDFNDIPLQFQRKEHNTRASSPPRDEKESIIKIPETSKYENISTDNSSKKSESSPASRSKDSSKNDNSRLSSGLWVLDAHNSSNSSINLFELSPPLDQQKETLDTSVSVKKEEALDTSPPHHRDKNNSMFGIPPEDDVSEEDIDQLLALQDDIENEMMNSQEICGGEAGAPFSPSVVSEPHSSNNSTEQLKSSGSTSFLHSIHLTSTFREEISELPYDDFLKTLTSKNLGDLQRLKTKLDDKIEDCMAMWRSLSRKSEELEKRLSKKGSTLNNSTVNKLLPCNASTPNLYDSPKFNQIQQGYQSSSSSQSPVVSNYNDSYSNNTSRPDSSGRLPAKDLNSSAALAPTTQPVNMNHPLLPKVQQVLKASFGLRTFRENQLNAILTVLDRNDTFILMPTGGGKSLCYQLTACVTDGVTIVVSPLRSLIFDQVQKLKSLKISAAYLSSDIKPDEEQRVYYELSLMNPGIKLLYLTPEKISISQKLASTLTGLYKRNKLDRIVIDEAHCVSQWGHDFRPDYKKLNLLRQNYPTVPIMGLTATATPRVQTDILFQLKMRNTKIFKQSFNRANLQYIVLPKAPKKCLDEMVQKIKTEMQNKSGIVYCFSRKDTDNVANHFKKAGIAAQSYHAGLTDKQRFDCHEKWMKNRVKVVCATIAFGMGIDKPDVRFVFHYTIPKSVEGYFQESGRAGRDGLKSICILYYSYGDMYKLRRMIESDKDNQATLKVHMDNLNRVVAYCENKIDCRRTQQMHYFGEEKFDSAMCKQNFNTTCDNCQISSKAQQLDVTDDAQKIIQSVNELGHGNNSNYREPIKNYYQRLTLNQFVDAFKGHTTAKGMNLDRLPLCNAGSKYTKMDAERLFRQMVLMRVLAEELVIGQHSNVIAYLKLGPRFSDVLTGQLKVKLTIHSSKSSVVSAASKKRKADDTEEHEEVKKLKEECLDQLSELRNEIANQNNLANPETIIGINVLRGLADALPSNEQEMFKCIGITENWYQIWGEEFLEVTKSFHEKVVALNLPPPVDDSTDLSELTSPHFDDNDNYDDITAPRKSDPSIGQFYKRKYQKRRSARGRGKGKGKSKRSSSTYRANDSKKSTVTAQRAGLACKLGLLNPPVKKKAR